jgi:hypothetical protein
VTRDTMVPVTVTVTVTQCQSPGPYGDRDSPPGPGGYRLPETRRHRRCPGNLTSTVRRTVTVTVTVGSH